MKKLLLILCLIMSFGFLYSQNDYKVHVEMSNANKETIVKLDEHISTYNRYINENVISFSTAENYSEWFIDSLFVKIGVEPFLVIKDKTEAYSIEKIGGNDCETAQILCSNSSQTANSGGAGAQELNGTNQGCLSTEHQSSWYYLNIQTGGTLNMVIDPANNSDDYDFAIWGPFTAATANANCPPVSSPIRCSYSACEDQTGIGSGIGCYSCYVFFTCYGPVTGTGSSEGTGGDSWVSTLNVNANEIYILLVDNFSNSGQPYNMSFGGTSVLGCTPVVLPVELLYFEGDNYEVGNIVKWKTESETNSDYFKLEWTSTPENENWVTINKQETYGPGNYGFVHNSFTRDAINYYRLSQVDNNGEEKYYGPIAINNKIPKKEIKKVYNLMGQEVDLHYQDLKIILYSDGSFEKRF